MFIKNRKKDGFSIIEVMVSFVIILVIVLLIGPSLFSIYDKSKDMSQVSDANAIINAIDMHNLTMFMEGEIDPIPDSMTMGEFKKIDEEYGYLNNWPKWMEDTMTIKDIKEIASGKDKTNDVSRVNDNTV